MKIRCPKCKTSFELRPPQLAKARSFETCPRCHYRFFVNTDAISGVMRPRFFQKHKGAAG
jgi:DNA-directed RNA polymerase subunit RPC12/RpoP